MDEATVDMMELKPTHHRYLLMEPRCSKEEEIRIIESSRHLEQGTKTALHETISGMTGEDGFLQLDEPTMWGVIGFRKLEVQLMESVAYREDREAGSLSTMERLRQSELEHNLNCRWMVLQALLVRYANRKIGRELNQADREIIDKFEFRPDTTDGPDDFETDFLRIGYFLRHYPTGKAFIPEGSRLNSIRPLVIRSWNIYVRWWLDWEERRGVPGRVHREEVSADGSQLIDLDPAKETVTFEMKPQTPQSASGGSQKHAHPTGSQFSGSESNGHDAGSGKKRRLSDAALEDAGHDHKRKQCTSPKKVYAVAVGREPGVYSDWPTAEEQTKGWKGAVHRSFTNEEEAWAYVDARKRPVPRSQQRGSKPPTEKEQSTSTMETKKRNRLLSSS